MSTPADDPGQPEIWLALGADENYALPLAVTMSTALRNFDRSALVRLLVIDGGMTDRSRARIERVARTARPGIRLEWHIVDLDSFSGVKVSDWGSHANYLRLAIPHLVPEASKVIYLDSDLIVRADLSRLYAESLQGASVLAVANYTHGDAGSVFGDEGARELLLDPSTPYFNSGVLVIDVSRWARDRVPERALQTARQFGHLMTFSDQDALNVTLADRWRPLDRRWNVMLWSLGSRFGSEATGTDDEELKRELINGAFIVHFGGRKKPWLAGYVGPMGGEFRRHLYKSLWFDSWMERLVWSVRYWLSPRWLDTLKIWLARTFPGVYSIWKRSGS